MPILSSSAELLDTSHGPNFLVVVLLASVALAIMLILIYVLVAVGGEMLVPGAHSSIEPAAHFALSVLALFAA